MTDAAARPRSQDHRRLPQGQGRAIREVCARFVGLCREMGLLTTASVAIDGSKFKAVSHRDQNFTRAKMARRRARIEASGACYLQRLATAARQEPSEARAAKITGLKEKIAKLGDEMRRLAEIEARTAGARSAGLADRSRCALDGDERPRRWCRGRQRPGRGRYRASSDRREVTNVGSDRSQLAHVAKATKATLEATSLDAVADRGYFNSEEILACEEAGITVTRPKPMTSNSKAEGRFGKQDFRYLAGEDVDICPAGERLAYHYTYEENGLVLHRYWTNACQSCPIKHSCTTAKERRIARWAHEHILEAVQRRLDAHPEKMRQRRETVEHPFGTIKARMGATHFLTKTLPRVAGEMALPVLVYTLTRVMNITGVQPLLAAIRI